MIWICPLWKPVAKSRGNLVEKRDCVGLLLVDMIISGWMTFLMFQQVTSPWWVFMFSYVTTNSICPGTEMFYNVASTDNILSPVRCTLSWGLEVMQLI